MSPSNQPSTARTIALAGEEVGRRTLWTELKANSAPLLFLSPATILVFLFFFLPVLLTIFISMTDMSTATFGQFNWVGLTNYVKMAKFRWTKVILKNTAIYVFFTLTLFNVGLGLVIALVTTHMERRVGFFFRTLWLLPRITPSVVYVMMWRWIAADTPYGILNQHVLGPLGVRPRDWVTAAPWVMVILVNGFIGASFGMIIFTSAIESIPKDYTRAARVDGASTWQSIRYVIIPMIKWPLLFVTTYQTLSLLTSFEQILLLTDGGPGRYGTEVWALNAYHRALANYWGNIQFGYGAALASVLVVIGIIMSFVYLRVFQFGSLVQEPRIETL